jgi:hypothetical protein
MASGLEPARYQFKLPAERGTHSLPVVVLEVYSSHPGIRISAKLLNIHGLNFSARHTSAFMGSASFPGRLLSVRLMAGGSQTFGVPQIYSQYPESRISAKLLNIHGLNFSTRNTLAISRSARFFGRLLSSHLTRRGSRVAARANCATLNMSRLPVLASKRQPAGEPLCAE